MGAKHAGFRWFFYRLFAACALVPMVAPEGFFIPSARAQQLPPGSTVLNRPRPSYAPLGVHVSNFWVYPKIKFKQGYDDNIFTRAESEIDDFVSTFEPAVIVHSDWNRHAVELGASANVGLYADNSEQNFEDYQMYSSGKIDVRHGHWINTTLTYSKQHEERDSPDNFGGLDPTISRGASVAIDTHHEFGRFVFALGAGANTLYFANNLSTTGSVVDNGDRDRDKYILSAQIDYSPSPRFNVFARGEFSTKEFDEPVDRFGLMRDSDRFEGGVGSDFQITGQLTGNLFVGYMSEDYEEALFDTVNEAIFDGEISWSPTGLTTFTCNVTRFVSSTTLNNSAGRLSHIGSITIDHELLRSLLLQVKGQYINDDFIGNKREDERYTYSAGATYFLNRKIHLSINYTRKERDSNAQGAAGNKDFVNNKLWIGIHLQI